VILSPIAEARVYPSPEYYGKPALVEGISVHPGRQAEDYNRNVMTRILESPSVSEMCAHVKHLGYAASGRIRLYGEEFEVLSDPFPEDDGIAVHVKTKKNSTVRVLQLPATVVQSAKARGPKAA
jgi:hypothetical protein